MTFTTSLKEELSKNEYSFIEATSEVDAFIKCIGKIKNEITIVLENASVARKIYKNIKKVYDVNVGVTIRIQKRFRIKQIYILTIKDKIEYIKNKIDSNNIKLLSDEEKIAFLEGSFLAIGNISNPTTSGYHLEYICSNKKIAKIIEKLLKEFSFNAKTITRGYKEIVYLKSSENISDLLKMFKATKSMFYFEDVRIYRDHKNMVNRLNNCELSNQIKSTSAGLKQIEDINYLENQDLLSLIDEKTQIVIDARKKYPEASLSELAEIISIEYNYQIGKSGVNHHFIKISNMVKRHKKNNE